MATDNSVVSRYEGRLEIDELRVVKSKNDAGKEINTVISRLSELRIVDVNTDIVLYTHNLPYGATLYLNDGDLVKKGDLVCEWDPYNAVIISEYDGKVAFENVIEGVTYRDEFDEQTGFREKVITESREQDQEPDHQDSGQKRRGTETIQPTGRRAYRREGERRRQSRRDSD